MDVVGHQAMADYAEDAAFSVLAVAFEVCAAVAVVAAFAQMLQLPVEQRDQEPAHDLILRDGGRVRALGADDVPFLPCGE